jgi:phosphoesterase RecJ-like protein
MEAGGNPTLITREFFQNRRLASIQLEARALDRMVLTADGALCYSFVMQNDFEELDAVKADADPIIDALRGIEGVRVALMLRENGEGEVRGSLRAKDDTDVAQVARTFDGGGHVAAAGFTFHGPMTEALVQVPRVAKRLCFGMEA